MSGEKKGIIFDIQLKIFTAKFAKEIAKLAESWILFVCFVVINIIVSKAL
jgi:hypothetical protein